MGPDSLGVNLLGGLGRKLHFLHVTQLGSAWMELLHIVRALASGSCLPPSRSACPSPALSPPLLGEPLPALALLLPVFLHKCNSLL